MEFRRRSTSPPRQPRHHIAMEPKHFHKVPSTPPLEERTISDAALGTPFACGPNAHTPVVSCGSAGLGPSGELLTHPASSACIPMVPLSFGERWKLSQDDSQTPRQQCDEMQGPRQDDVHGQSEHDSLASRHNDHPQALLSDSRPAVLYKMNELVNALALRVEALDARAREAGSKAALSDADGARVKPAARENSIMSLCS